MTKEAAIKWKEEIKALQEGKTIQIKRDGIWYDYHNPRFNEEEEYRIKPEPREFWIVMQKNLFGEWQVHRTFNTLGSAKFYLNTTAWTYPGQIIKVVEVER